MARPRGAVVRGRRSSARSEPELVDDAGGKQRLRDRDAGVDADVPAGLLLEIPDELDQLPSITLALAQSRSRASTSRCTS